MELGFEFVVIFYHLWSTKHNVEE